MFTAFLRAKLLSKRRPLATRRFVRPTLEHLEDRCVPAGAYLQTNLVSDQAGMAAHTDPNLINPWGIAFAPDGPFWVADNGSGVSTLYDGTGAIQSAPFIVPTPTGGTPPSAPTGIVYNGTADFVVGTGAASGPAQFIFDTEDGTLSGWNPSANATTAILEVDNSKAGAVYKGLALGSNATDGNLLFATNFNAGTVDVFDKNFKPVNLGANAFKDSTIPAGFAPFGISDIGGNIYVTYAKQDAAKHDPVAGVGNGFVDVFDTNGNLRRRVTSGGALNSPWGLVIAPSNFGTFSNDLLIGNFGDGLINVYNPTTGASLGQLQDTKGNAIQIDGLWALTFGNGAGTGATNTLFFSAGPNSETHGLFGSLTVTTATTLTQPDELAAYRPSDGSWSLDSDGTTGFNSSTDQVFFSFSPPGVIGVAGDWTGSGTSKIGDFSNGTWHLDLNDNGVLDPGETFTFGQAGDQPVVGDWTGNGVTNIGVFRAAPDGITGEFILDTNGDHIMDAGDQTFTFGLATDRIVIGDWNGAGKDEVGVFRDAASFNPADAGDAIFSLDTNGNQQFDAGDQVFVFGLITDHLIVGDWNGAGKSEVGVYRDGSTAPPGNPLFAPGTALFSLDTNGDLQFDSGNQVFLYGLTTDQFVSGHWAKTPPLQPEGTPQVQATNNDPPTTPTVPPYMPQFAANGPGRGGAAPLTEAQLQPVEQQAIAAWVAKGANLAQLEAARVQIATLDDNLVGETSGNQITLDATADGWGWNTDTSGADFTSTGAYGLQATPGSAAAGEMDLLTVLEHEYGHILGLPDVNPLTQPNNLMAATLPVGVRRSPTVAADAVFATRSLSQM